MEAQTVEIKGKVYTYGGVMTHKTVTAGFTFKERMALLFGKPVTVISEIYFKNEVRPIVATANATVEPLIKPKPKLKSYNMTDVNEEIPQTNGKVENPVEEVQPQDEGTNAGTGDVPAEEPAEEPVAKEVPRADWKDDVRVEAKELKEKIVKLKTAMDGGQLPAASLPLLTEQYGLMNALYVVLNKRLSS